MLFAQVWSARSWNWRFEVKSNLMDEMKLAWSNPYWALTSQKFGLNEEYLSQVSPAVKDLSSCLQKYGLGLLILGGEWLAFSLFFIFGIGLWFVVKFFSFDQIADHVVVGVAGAVLVAVASVALLWTIAFMTIKRWLHALPTVQSLEPLWYKTPNRAAYQQLATEMGDARPGLFSILSYLSFILVCASYAEQNFKEWQLFVADKALQDTYKELPGRRSSNTAV